MVRVLEVWSAARIYFHNLFTDSNIQKNKIKIPITVVTKFSWSKDIIFFRSLCLFIYFNYMHILNLIVTF